MWLVETVANAYITLIPVILMGAANMAFCKSPLLASLSIPIDGGKVFSDGKRVFGDNKTIRGFLGYLVFGMVFYAIWGAICSLAGIEESNLFYAQHAQSLPYDLLVGFSLGLAYSAFELPNSFLKRRFDVTPGKLSKRRGLKTFFFILDQVDSMFGCALAVYLFSGMTMTVFATILIVGAITKVAINCLLYALHLRSNRF